MAAEGFVRELRNKVFRLLAQALFFDVMAEKSDQPCSTFLLRQCGQTMFSISCWATVKLFENVFLQA